MQGYQWHAQRSWEGEAEGQITYEQEDECQQEACNVIFLFFAEVQCTVQLEIVEHRLEQ